MRGKRGYGPCKSTQNAVPVFERLQKRNKPQPTDRIFPKYHHAMFKRILEELGLKFDREGRPRTLYSLRHELYCDFVRNAKKPEDVPLLIPEFRYGGQAAKHEYRLDFCVIDADSMDKIGFELSPWSTHGELTGIAGKTQKAVNAEALANFEREMKKHKTSSESMMSS